MGTLLHASAAVTSGAADVVVAVPGDPGPIRSHPFRRREDVSEPHVPALGLDRDAMVHAARGADPRVLDGAEFDPLHASVRRDERGFRPCRRPLREYAAKNPAAWGFERPISLEDHQESRWIAEPCIHLLDCCQETDGSVALVITNVEDRAAELTDVPVLISAASGAGLFEQEIASDHYRPDLSVMDGSVALGRAAFRRPGFSRDDIDVAMIYDPSPDPAHAARGPGLLRVR